MEPCLSRLLLHMPEEGTDADVDIGDAEGGRGKTTLLLRQAPLTVRLPPRPIAASRPTRCDLPVLTLWPHDTLASCDTTVDPMLEEFASSVAASQIVMCPPVGSRAAATAASQLEDEATMVVSCECTRGLSGRQQTHS